MMNRIDLRKWPRHPVRFSISFSCQDPKRPGRSWHVGQTHDVSAGGMRIISSVLKTASLSSEIDILCFPEKQILFPEIQDPEPVSMTGQVMWQDKRSGAAGIRLRS